MGSFIGYIYKITNNVTNKCYIGQTTRKDPMIRIRAHFNHQPRSCNLIFNSSRKHGVQNFTSEVLCCSINQSDLDHLEKYFIQYYDSLVPSGYNIQTGGSAGNKFTEKTKLKISNALRGKPSKLKGVPKTPEHRASMSKSRKGFTSENRIKSAKRRGLTLRKPVKSINIETNEIRYFDGISTAANELNVQACNISRVCNQKQNRSQAKGFYFEFLNPEERYLFKKKKPKKKKV